jgi:hypothetical protein
MTTLDKFFENKGINVRMNTLGFDENLIKAYVGQTFNFVNKSELKHSERIKMQCYSQFYDFEDRQKYTGFELIKELDFKFRVNIAPLVSSSQFSPTLIVDEKSHLSDFKHILIDSLISTVKPIILYLSGGLDSELVANALLEARIDFVPCIFTWVNNNGDVLNAFDTQYAVKFCARHNLVPKLCTLNIEALWNSEHFKQLAIDTQIISTQILTYVYMICITAESMDRKYCHLLGGEVRYRTNYLNDDGSSSSLVMLNKVSPSYNGKFFQAEGASPTNSIRLNYFTDGTWSVTASHAVGGILDTNTGLPTTTTGTFANPPLAASGYQYRITASAGSTSGLVPAINAVPTAWADIPNGVICSVSASAPSGFTAGKSGDFTIELRPISQPGAVLTSTIHIGCTADNS